MTISARTKDNLSSSLNELPGVLIIAGDFGSGVNSLVDYVLSTINESKILVSDRIIIDNSTISIDDVREIKLRLKTKSAHQNGKRLICIQSAHRMTPEAQNALLKVLEDVPLDTHFILFTDAYYKLLPTVHSRATLVTVSNPNYVEYENYYKQLDKAELRRRYVMTGGLPELMEDLNSDGASKYASAVTAAKELVASSVFERLCRVDELVVDKMYLRYILFGLLQIYKSIVETSDDNMKQQKALQTADKVLSAINTSETVNVNHKLLLTDTFLSM